MSISRHCRELPDTKGINCQSDEGRHRPRRDLLGLWATASLGQLSEQAKTPVI
jgi:hypothetical protein